MLDIVKVTSDVKVNSARPRDMLNVPHRGILLLNISKQLKFVIITFPFVSCTHMHQDESDGHNVITADRNISLH